jgi:hypothetical protein
VPPASLDGWDVSALLDVNESFRTSELVRETLILKRELDNIQGAQGFHE